MSTTIIEFIIAGVITIISAWGVAWCYMLGRSSSIKKGMVKKAVVIVLYCAMLIGTAVRYNYHHDLENKELPDDLDLMAVELMQEKFNSVSEYTFYDHGQDIMYTVPNPLPECPFTLTSMNGNNEIEELTINSYEELPVLLDTVWYWYGTQSMTGEYYMLTFGDVCTMEDGESQTFFMFGEDNALMNIYTANLPIEDNTLNLSTIWAFPLGSLCAALVWMTLQNLVIFMGTMKKRKAGRTVVKGGR